MSQFEWILLANVLAMFGTLLTISTILLAIVSLKNRVKNLETNFDAMATELGKLQESKNKEVESSHRTMWG